MPRIVKKVDKGPLQKRETFIKQVANRSLTTEHCEFFLNKYGSHKVFQKYISKYYPQNGACSFHLDSKNKLLMLPSIQEECRSMQKENRVTISESVHQNKSRYKMCQKIEIRQRKVNSVQFYGFRLNEIIKKTKTEHRQSF